jgi:hypothetical protein
VTEQRGGAAMNFVGYVIGIVLIAFATFWLGNFHIVHKRPDWQLFGCKDTYINDKGEDTGECR